MPFDKHNTFSAKREEEIRLKRARTVSGGSMHNSDHGPGEKKKRKRRKKQVKKR